MCGIVAAVAQRDVAPLLISGLEALEYRGYDSAGLAVINDDRITRIRAQGKVNKLKALYENDPFPGRVGIAHTRWATHGAPSCTNAHPHVVGRVAVVHNGIIENHEHLRRELKASGCQFTSQTDTEVIAHLFDHYLNTGADMHQAMRQTIARLEGTYAIAVIDRQTPQRIMAARQGSPLVVGIGIGENFIASDVQALIQVTRKVVYLEEGDLVEIDRHKLDIFTADGQPVERAVHESELSQDAVQRGQYRHYMRKEIDEQPQALANTLEGRLGSYGVLEHIFGVDSAQILASVKHVHIIACGTSYHAGLIGKYWIEKLAQLPVSVEVASEYRYRDVVVPEGSLFVAISQSGETADTLAALRATTERGYLATLAICNIPESSLVRESNLCLMTRAGPEIGVASTKAFTTQLAAMALLTLTLGQYQGMEATRLAALTRELSHLPQAVNNALACEQAIIALAEKFVHRQHALFLGRGNLFPVALEGALKLKEISYIHAEAYPAGELKHGPLALVDENMPVLAVAPNNALLAKLESNLQEVRARGGRLAVLTATDTGLTFDGDENDVISIEANSEFLAPIVFTVPLQLLAYHVAVLRGTDVDQPRNLAKSVTVE